LNNNIKSFKKYTHTFGVSMKGCRKSEQSSVHYSPS
jgi:hypothetical protein